mmetsp:Transcript_24627/g.56432  ORF Transcript_24627/g.56432 Transcript_24627/m.56432 type:complete len:238 (+) Transcript_24627:1071-1784(+)
MRQNSDCSRRWWSFEMKTTTRTMNGFRQHDVGTLSQTHSVLRLRIHFRSQKVQIKTVPKPRYERSRPGILLGAPEFQKLQEARAGGPALDLAEVDVPQREARQGLVQRPRRVGQREHHRGLGRHVLPVGSCQQAPHALPSQQEESGEVGVVVFDGRLDDVQAVGLCGQIGGDGGGVLLGAAGGEVEGSLGEHLGRASGIIDGEGGDVVRAKVVVALGEGLGVGDGVFYFVDVFLFGE